MPRFRCSSSVIVVGACLALGGSRAWAHDEKASASEVEVGERVLVWKVDVGIAGLEKKIKLPASGPDLTDRDLQSTKAEIAEYLKAGLVVTINGRVAPPVVGGLQSQYEPFIATGAPMITRVVLELRYESETPIDKVHASVRFFSDLTSQHLAMINVRWGDERRQLVRMGAAELDLQGLDPGRLAVVREFLLWGTHHIFYGYDHIAFLLALLLVAVRIGEVLKIVTAFTVAHSLTLLLAALEIVRLPSRITEALIAASIVYVAADNLIRRSVKHRWLLTFAFGLVHGLGFATELRVRLATMAGRVLLPVVSFNLGVEVGQIIIVAAVYPLLYWLRRAADDGARAVKQKRLVRVGSVPILLLGFGWLVQRLVG